MKDNLISLFVSICVALYVGRVTITVENAYLAVGAFLTMFGLAMFFKYMVINKIK